MEDYKAKYEEALGWMKEVYPTLQGAAKEDAEHFFPELKESDDDRMKKLCISVVKQFAAVCRKEDKYLPEVEKCIAWLEKQGEQKPVTDFSDIRTWKYIVDAVLTEKEGIGQYLDSPFTEEIAKKLQKRFGNIEQKSADKVEPKFKVGDVVTNKKSKDTVKIVQILHDSYCYSGWDGAATVHSDFSISEQDDWELVEQKSAWSEEDEKILNLIIARLHSHPNVEVEEYGKDYHWLNSLENRVQPQPKQEWSEEGEETLKDIITSMTNLKDSATSDALRDIYNSKIDWLKSLRPHNQWKPREEQMKALEHAINCYSGISPTNTEEVYTLEIMKEQLKKLKGE